MRSLILVLLLWCSVAYGADSDVLSRGIVYRGDAAPIAAVMAKAQAGKPITVAGLGGSITAGAAADPGKDYLSLVCDWLRAQYPAATVTKVNAGLPGTPSRCGNNRYAKDVAPFHPDLLLVEFAVNDEMGSAAKRCTALDIEGAMCCLISKGQKGGAAVLLLETMQRDGTNAQAAHEWVAQEWNVPMVSARNALLPEAMSGRLALSGLWADHLHPNTAGHRWLADLVTYYLRSTVTP